MQRRDLPYVTYKFIFAELLKAKPWFYSTLWNSHNASKHLTFDHSWLCFVWHALPSVACLWTTVLSQLILHVCGGGGGVPQLLEDKVKETVFTLIAPSCLVPARLQGSPMMLCFSFDLCTMQNTKGTSNTHFKVRNTALLLFVPALSWNPWVLNLTFSIIYFWFCFLQTRFDMTKSWKTSKGSDMAWRSDSYSWSHYHCTGQAALVNYQCHPSPDEENNCGSGCGGSPIWMQRRFECCSRDVKSNALVSINHWSIPAQSSIASFQGDIFFQSVSNPRTCACQHAAQPATDQAVCGCGWKAALVPPIEEQAERIIILFTVDDICGELSLSMLISNQNTSSCKCMSFN